MKRLTYILAAAAVMFAAPAFAQQYDLVINGGRVMDGEAPDMRKHLAPQASKVHALLTPPAWPIAVAQTPSPPPVLSPRWSPTT
jgi:hypothetical protein